VPTTDATHYQSVRFTNTYSVVSTYGQAKPDSVVAAFHTTVASAKQKTVINTFFSAIVATNTKPY